ncbi:MAG: hypothetical protein PHY43_10445 [Verrucomicrobiales bacterium]|nr:hypothetical protein [Verrucomicrobiales bacterium]
MKPLFILILAVINQTLFSQNAVQFSQTDRKFMATAPIDFSWTNRIKVTKIENFPICGYLNPNPMFSPYVSTNKPDFMLFEKGMFMLSFPFELRDKEPIRSDFFLSFHINQWAYIEEMLGAFNSYRITLTKHRVFPISMSLGEIRPSPYDNDSNKYFRFTIHVTAEGHAMLLVETGERSITGGPPDHYDLNILDNSQVDEVKRMLDGLPDLKWWKQKAMGIIPSPPIK